MDHQQKRRWAIAIIAALGSLMAVSLYISGSFPEGSMVIADEQEEIQSPE